MRGGDIARTTWVACTLLACGAAPAWADPDPCRLISTERQAELGLTGWQRASVPADLDAKGFGLNARLSGRSCQFKRGQGDLVNVLSIFDVRDEGDRAKLASHLRSRTQDAALQAAAQAGQIAIPTKAGVCDAHYILESQVSICIGLLPGAFVLASIGERNATGKAFAPLTLMKLFDEVEATWAAARP